MATIVDAPSALGTYMLKGWVLTDHPCPNTGCKIPLLRSPAGQNPPLHFCVICDGSPDVPRQSSTTGAEARTDSSTDTSLISQTTRASTPATDASDASDDFPPFVETEEMLRRREHTDRASAEIGRRLLRGWTMLDDECPQESCYYVPLVRPPKSGGEIDPRKECVLCGQIYIMKRDQNGREQLVLAGPGMPSQTTVSGISPSSSVEAAGELPQSNPLTSSISPLPMSAASGLNTQLAVATAPPLMGLLESSTEALQLSLQALTSRLTSLTSNPALVDPTAIGTTAEAMSKVTQALSQVKQLQWGEAQAHATT